MTRGMRATQRSMISDHTVLAELATFLGLDTDDDDVAGAAFDRLGFPGPAYDFCPGHIAELVVELERRREAGLAMREYDEERLGLLYYEPGAAGVEEAQRMLASERFVHRVAASISKSFSGPWP